VAAILLLPVPVYATMTFGPWVIGSTDPSIGATPDITGSILTFTPFSSASGDVTIAGATRVFWDGQGNTKINATFQGWNLTGSGSVNFQVTYAGNNMFPIPNQTIGSIQNPFSGTPPQPLVIDSKGVVLTFTVHLVGSSWTPPSGTTHTLFFTNVQ
jgi:hypothetical protein